MRILYLLSIILISNYGIAYGLAAEVNEEKISYIFQLIKSKQWQEAENNARQINNKTLTKIILVQKFLDPDSESTFTEIINFLQHNPNWSQTRTLQVRAEELLDNNTDKNLIIKWFTKNKPISPKGYKYYALAAAEILKDSHNIAPFIKQGWIYGNFDPKSPNKEQNNEQNNYYNRFKSFLTEKDTVAKIDRHLWDKQITIAKSLLPMVSSGYRKSFAVQIEFLNQNKDAVNLFNSVPASYRTPGLIYQYLQKIKHDLPESKVLTELLAATSHDKKHADQFWKLQSYFVREYLEKKKYQDAYKLSAKHFAVNNSHISEAEFLAGWLALRYLNKPVIAINHFQQFNTVVATPISKARGIYWLGRAYLANGESEKAKSFFLQAASEYGYTFYGQVATMELKHTRLLLADYSSTDDEDLAQDNYVKNNEIVKATHIVFKYGTVELVRIYINAAIEQATKPEQVYAIINSLTSNKSTDSKNIHYNVWLSKNAMQKHVLVKTHAYPTPYRLIDPVIELPLIYSIVRQESVFHQQAVSSANASGLMQLLPSTACTTAKTIGLKCIASNLLSDPEYNLTLGSNYLKELLELYNNSYILAIAAYNAGPHRVDKWIKIYGDPREMPTVYQVIDWLETIPFSETRNYVQRVLENLQIYRAILNKHAKFKLYEDLTNKKRIL